MFVCLLGHKGPSSGSLTEFGGLDGKIKQEPSGNGMNLPMMSHQHHTSSNIFLEENNVLSNMELTNILQGTDKPLKRQHKRKASDDLLWKSTKRKTQDDAELLLETSSSDSTSRSTPLSQETEIPTPNSALGFHSDLELSGLDPTELIGGEDKSTEFDNIDELSDVEEMLTGKNKKQDKLLIDLGDSKGLVPPSVSITPIPTSSSPNYKQNIRSGIEIIPISSSATTNTSLSSSSSNSSSITITPITATKDEKIKERKSSKNRSDDKSRLEKKKKRRREENAMGPPPDKLPLKQQDPLMKPVTVSIKPSESPPSPNMMRKFSPSPTQNRTTLSGKLSPSMLKTSLKSHSPKHSPIHSPKHIISSPKGTSPKHPSTISGSGKPSMSALKNAANSPSSKSGGESSSKSNKSLNKESSRDKEKKLSIFNCTKVKSSSIKMKQLDCTEINDNVITQEATQTNVIDGCKNALVQMKNRKGNLLAVIDKLKSAQHCETPADLSSKTNNSNRERTQISNKTSSSEIKTNIKVGGETKNSEYMVKPSSDGMKITINKTRTKDSMKSSGSMLKSSGSGSPKTHTGLKPGVTSGPASKKPLNLNQKISANSSLFKTSKTSVKTSSSLMNLNKTSSSSSSSSSSRLGSPKLNSSNTNATDLTRKQKLNKSSSEKSIFTMKESRKSSPTPNKDESDYKLYSSPLMMEGLMKQQFDKNFQIPKLSARMNEDKKLKINSDTINNTVKTERSPLALLSTPNDKLRNNVLPSTNNTLTTSTSSKDDFDLDQKTNYPIAVTKSISEPLSLSTKSSNDNLTKFIAPAAPKDDLRIKEKCNTELLLDFSNKTASVEQQKSGTTSGTGVSPYPQSPSVSVHIVKSPAPSPLINPSPHSTSPSCITDDELMDEALVGLGK